MPMVQEALTDDISYLVNIVMTAPKPQRLSTRWHELAERLFSEPEMQLMPRSTNLSSFPPAVPLV